MPSGPMWRWPSVAEQRRKPSEPAPAQTTARGTPQPIRLSRPANDNPVPRAVVLARAAVALAALGAAASVGYLYLG
jgi:hypothetical protein